MDDFAALFPIHPEYIENILSVFRLSKNVEFSRSSRSPFAISSIKTFPKIDPGLWRSIHIGSSSRKMRPTARCRR